MEKMIDAVLGDKVNIRILRFLNHDSGLRSGRELARAVGYSHTYTINHLRSLEELGVVTRHRIGNANAYELNRDNYLVKKVLVPVFKVEKGYLEELASRFTSGLKDELLRIILFGSTASGRETAESDIDLVLVVKNDCDLEETELEAAGIAAAAMAEFGCRIDALVFKERTFKARLRSGQGMWKDLQREGVELLGAGT
jgi:predicted nucleotidyltransferase